MSPISAGVYRWTSPPKCVRSNRQQQSMPRNSNTHPQEMDQADQRSTACWAETHRSLHREEEVQTASLLSGPGDERVQQVHSELQKHTDRCRKTNTHTHIDRRRFQRASRSKRQNRNSRLQIHRKNTHPESETAEANSSDTGQSNTN